MPYHAHNHCDNPALHRDVEMSAQVILPHPRRRATSLVGQSLEPQPHNILRRVLTSLCNAVSVHRHYDTSARAKPEQATMEDPADIQDEFFPFPVEIHTVFEGCSNYVWPTSAPETVVGKSKYLALYSEAVLQVTQPQCYCLLVYASCRSYARSSRH